MDIDSTSGWYNPPFENWGLQKNYIYLMREIQTALKILQSKLDYPDSLGPHEIVLIIEGPDNKKYEY